MLQSCLALLELESLQSCLTLCDPVDCSPPGCSVHGTSQARIWSGLPCPPPGDLPDPEIKPVFPPVSCIAADSLLLSHQGSVILPRGLIKGSSVPTDDVVFSRLSSGIFFFCNFYLKKKLFIFCWAGSLLHVQAFSSCHEQRLLFVEVYKLLIVLASPFAECRL